MEYIHALRDELPKTSQHPLVLTNGHIIHPPAAHDYRLIRVKEAIMLYYTQPFIKQSSTAFRDMRVNYNHSPFY